MFNQAIRNSKVLLLKSLSDS